jgi:UV DNA damage endonuclease
MKKEKIGYCCINLSLGDKVKVNRTMIKKTFESKGIKYASELIIKNLIDLEKILIWNIENNILNYRLSSDMFPWLSEYNYEDLPNYEIVVKQLVKCGELIKNSNMKVSLHPGPFNVLSSENPDVVKKTIKELNQHSKLLELMGLPANHFYNINIHIGSVNNNKQKSMDNFCRSFDLLEENTKKALTIENDDTKNSYSVNDLVYVNKQIKTPIVFDSLHHYCNPGNLSFLDALETSLDTWGIITPECHHSSSKRLYEDNTKTIKTHADFIYDNFECDKDIYLTIEAKQKDLAVFDFYKKFNYN